MFEIYLLILLYLLTLIVSIINCFAFKDRQCTKQDMEIDNEFNNLN